jgi:3-phenylpropionate/cinnamic acid dioxygenase small subunit
VTVADRLAINQAFASYAWAMDAKDWDLLGQVFTEDASFTVAVAGGPTVGPFEGRAAIVDFISSTTAAQQDQRRHVITNVRMEREGPGEATATAILTLIVTAAGELTVHSTGPYRVDVVDEGDAWRFRRMHLALDRPF